MYLQMVFQLQSTSPQSWHLHWHQQSPLQTWHGWHPNISGTNPPKIMLFYIKVHDKLGHEGINRTYHLIKWQYHWKGMNKNIHKCIANCAFSKREKVKNADVPTADDGHTQLTFDKIAIDFISDLNICTSGNQHILIIIDHLMGWLEAFPIPDKRQTLLSVFLSTIISPSTCVPDSYCLTMEQNSGTK